MKNRIIPIIFFFFFSLSLFFNFFLEATNLEAAPCRWTICKKPSGNPLIIRAIELAFKNNEIYRGRFDLKSQFDYPISFYNDQLKIKPYGFIKFEAYADSRQVEGVGDKQLLFFPRPIILDKNGKDINARGSINATIYEMRLGLKFKGINYKDIQTKALFEVDLRGFNEPALITGLPEANRDFTLGSIRTRLACLIFKWPQSTILAGLFWHPLVILDCYPHTVSFSRGIPFDVGARNPQIRYSYKRANWDFSFTALTQLQFESPGPFGFSSQYLAQALVPNLNIRGIYRFSSFEDTLIGFCCDYKRLIPRLVTDTCYKTNEDINTGICEVFGAITKAPWSLRAKVIWAQNAAEHGLISGYAVHTRAVKTDVRTYTPTTAVSTWIDFSYIFGCDDREVGFFAGYSKNLGSSKTLFFNQQTGRPLIYSLTELSPNIDYIARITPRFVMSWQNIRFGTELEWTRAAYGCIDKCGLVQNACPVDNFRVLSGIFYLF